MLTYKVPDMSCQHCVAAITEAVRGVDPDARIEADLPAGRVRIDSTTDTGRLEDALREAGYPAERLKQ